MLHEIFLSYSHKDTTIMLKLRDEFHKANLKVWTDENIEPGTPSWRKAIENAIKQAGCVVVIFSPDANESDGVQAEIEYAQLQNKPLFPVLANGDKSTSIPFGFTAFQWVDIREETTYLNRIEYLIATIRKTLNILPIENLPTIDGRIVLTGSQSARYLSEKFQQPIRPDQITRWVQQGLFETVNVSTNGNYLIYRDSLFIPPRKRIVKSQDKRLKRNKTN